MQRFSFQYYVDIPEYFNSENTAWKLSYLA